MHGQTAREPWVDALRALAVLGVFIVNGLGYAFMPAYPLQIGPPQPIDSSAALAAHGWVVAVVQGKAWPLLSFLFGYSLCSIALSARVRGQKVQTVLRRRYVKLLVIGLLHGCVVYFGDILTMYAVGGLLMGHWALDKPAQLLKMWRRTSVVIALMVFIYAFSALTTWFPASDAKSLNLNYNNLERFGNIVTPFEFLALNASSYLWQQLNSFVGFLPFVLWTGIAGILARRFQLLGQATFARHFWAQHVGSIQCTLAWLTNLGLATASVYLHHSEGYSERSSAVATLSGVAGLWLAAALLATAMRHMHRSQRIPSWAMWLAPAGKHTLVMYLGLSACLVLSNGAFLDLTAGTITTLLALVGGWMIALLLGRAASARGLRDPIARWLSR
jgi:uncharacterized protein